MKNKTKIILIFILFLIVFFSISIFFIFCFLKESSSLNNRLLLFSLITIFLILVVISVISEKEEKECLEDTITTEPLLKENPKLSFINIKEKLLFKKTHPDAVLPYSHLPTDSGYDLTAVEDVVIPAKQARKVNVGLEVAYIPKNFWLKIESRSGLSFKHNIISHPGVIDNEYRGDMGVLLYNFSDKDYKVSKGDRIAQFTIIPLYKAEVMFSETKKQSKRNEKGFGSSGK